MSILAGREWKKTQSCCLTGTSVGSCWSFGEWNLITAVLVFIMTFCWVNISCKPYYLMGLPYRLNTSLTDFVTVWFNNMMWGLLSFKNKLFCCRWWLHPFTREGKLKFLTLLLAPYKCKDAASIRSLTTPLPLQMDFILVRHVCRC